MIVQLGAEKELGNGLHGKMEKKWKWHGDGG
jgi:hypothetical protein